MNSSADPRCVQASIVRHRVKGLMIFFLEFRADFEVSMVHGVEQRLFQGGPGPQPIRSIETPRISQQRLEMPRHRHQQVHVVFQNKIFGPLDESIH